MLVQLLVSFVFVTNHFSASSVLVLLRNYFSSSTSSSELMAFILVRLPDLVHESIAQEEKQEKEEEEGKRIRRRRSGRKSFAINNEVR